MLGCLMDKLFATRHMVMEKKLSMIHLFTKDNLEIT